MTLRILSLLILFATPVHAQDMRALLSPRDPDAHYSYLKPPSFGIPADSQWLAGLGLCDALGPVYAHLSRPVHRFYRLLDLDTDGHEELVYSGPYLNLSNCGTGEGTATYIWRLTASGPTEQFRAYAFIQEIGASEHGSTHATLHYPGCCGEFVMTWTFIRIASGGNRLAVDTTNGILTTWMTVQGGWERWLETPIPFVVTRSRYNLRYAPVIDDTSGGPLEMVGRSSNLLAVFHAGDRGLALAESHDTTGRLWWLVLMDPAIPDSSVTTSAIDLLRYRWVGWMSSRYLRRVTGIN